MSAHTPGPWKWTVNPKSFDVELSRGGVGDIVLSFARWGMGGATPLFRDDRGMLKRAVDLSVTQPGREHHASWWRLIDHPDAHLIAAAPTLLALLKECLANSPGRTSDWRARVEKSIARAEGRQP